MSDINRCFVSGKIVGKIDLRIGKNECAVTQFWIEGTVGKIKCVALYDVAKEIAEKYSEGKYLEVEGILRLDKWMKTSGEVDQHWEILVENLHGKNYQFLTGQIFDAPKEIKGKDGKLWTVFKLASGAQRDIQKLKGDPVIIECWTNSERFGLFLSKNFKLGTHMTVCGNLRANDAGKVCLFIKTVDVWWNALHLMNGTSEELINNQQKKTAEAF